MTRETAIKTALTVTLCALLALSIFFLIDGWLNGHFDSVETLRVYVESFGVWAPLVLTLIQLLQVILPVLPVLLGYVVGSVLFGTIGGFLVNYIGISIGSLIAFSLARRFCIRLVSKMVSMEKYEKFIQRINQSKSYTIFLLLAILLPFVPDDFLCYFSGLVDMSPKKFIIIILTAKPWCILFYSFFFSYFI